MKNLKTSAKIIVGFGSILILLLFITLTIAFTNINSIKNIDIVSEYTDFQTLNHDVLDIFNETRMSAHVLYYCDSEVSYSNYN